jgi:hypothetical protein
MVFNQICFLRNDDDSFDGWVLKDFRHGRLLFEQWGMHLCTAWDPITQDFHEIRVHQQFFDAKIVHRYWAVLCGIDAADHVQGHYLWSPVKVVLVGTYKEDNQGFVIASVFSDNGWHDVPAKLGHHMWLVKL